LSFWVKCSHVLTICSPLCPQRPWSQKHRFQFFISQILKRSSWSLSEGLSFSLSYKELQCLAALYLWKSMLMDWKIYELFTYLFSAVSISSRCGSFYALSKSTFIHSFCLCVWFFLFFFLVSWFNCCWFMCTKPYLWIFGTLLFGDLK